MVIYTAAVDLKYTYFPLQKKEEYSTLNKALSVILL